jgi:hypothetical protein
MRRGSCLEVEVTRWRCPGGRVQVEVSNKVLKSRCVQILVPVSECPSEGVSCISLLPFFDVVSLLTTSTCIHSEKGKEWNDECHYDLAGNLIVRQNSSQRLLF